MLLYLCDLLLYFKSSCLDDFLFIYFFFSGINFFFWDKFFKIVRLEVSFGEEIILVLFLFRFKIIFRDVIDLGRARYIFLFFK